jgi:hypothetical protein
VEVAATFQTIEEAATKLDGAREEAAATMDAVAQVQACWGRGHRLPCHPCSSWQWLVATGMSQGVHTAEALFAAIPTCAARA